MSPTGWSKGYKPWCYFILTVVLLQLIYSVAYQTEDRPESTNEQAPAYTLSDEKRLIKRLLKNYENAGITGRPVKTTHEKVLVEMSLSLIQILDLDEKNQVLTISVWLLFHWTDHILKWDPKNYSQVLEVRVPPKQVWTPDIVLYNYADERLKEMRDAMVIVQYDGSISWMPPAIFKSSCKIDIKRFPFDEQTCHMKFGSWTYDGNRLDVTFISNESQVLLDDYTESNEWEIIARPALRNVKYYPCCKEPYPDLTYFLFLRRNAAFFSYILVLPCVLLSSLTLVIFWLPPESPAKMVLGMNIFVAFFLLLLLLADSTPQASTSVPYIGYYYCLNMILITLSSFLSVIVINLYFRGDRRNRVPACVRTICHALTGTCMNDPTVPSTTPGSQVPASNSPSVAVDPSKLPSSTLPDPEVQLRRAEKQKTMEQSMNGSSVPLLRDSMSRKVRKGRTRFATNPTGDLVETVLSQATIPEIRVAHGVMPEQDEEEPRDRASLRKCRLTNEHEIKAKLRSRSLTPAKHSLHEFSTVTDCPMIRNNPHQMHKMTCNVCDAEKSPHVCHLCHHSASPVSACPCCVASSNVTLSSSRHQRHPQSCQACLQHLNALRAHRTLNKTSDSQIKDSLLYSDHTSVVHCIPNPSATGKPEFWNQGCLVCDCHQPSYQHQQHINFSQGPVTSDSYAAPIVTLCGEDCSQFRYEYRKGRLALIPNETHESPNHLEDTIDLCYTKNGVNCHRLNGQERGRVKDRRELIHLTQTVEEEIRAIRQAVRTFLDRISKKDTENVIVREWRMVAMVMDRIFFVCYLIIHLCAAFGLLVPTSHDANVVGYLRDYRLKNYNATYVDGEAMGLGEPGPQSGQATTDLPRMDKSGLIQDRQPTNEVIPGPANRVVLDNAISKLTPQIKPTETSPSGFLALSPLSPYQRLVDEKSQGKPGAGIRSTSDSTSASYMAPSPKTTNLIDPAGQF